MSPSPAVMKTHENSWLALLRQEDSLDVGEEDSVLGDGDTRDELTQLPPVNPIPTTFLAFYPSSLISSTISSGW